MICNIPVDQNSVFAPTLDGLSSSWNSLEYNFVKKEKKKKKRISPLTPLEEVSRAASVSSFRWFYNANFVRFILSTLFSQE